MREDWEEVELGEICNFVGGGTPSKSNPEYWNGNIPWASIKDIKGNFLEKTQDFISEIGLKESASNLALENEIILATRINPGKPIISKIKTAINQDLKVVKNKAEIDTKFLFYNFKNLEKTVIQLSSGTTVLGINLNNLNTISTPLAPLPIQRAIVSKIEALFSDLDNGIANFKKAQEQLKTYRQAVLKKAFEGELTKEWREKIVQTPNLGVSTQLPSAEELLKQIKQERQNHYNQQIEDWKKAVKEWEKNGKKGRKPSKPTALKELILLKEKELKELPIIPDGWFYSEIGNICDCIVPNRDKPKSFSGDIKWITTPDLDEKLIKLDYSKVEIGLSEEEVQKYNARVIPINSVIMTCVGTLGLSSIVEKKIVINQQLHAFLPEKYYLPKALAYYIRLNKNFYERISTSTTIQYVNKEKCNSLPFPFCTIPEQAQIVQEIESRLSVCDKVEQSINESIIKAEALRQSILKKAFEGKLLSSVEIEQCKAAADYEPAAKLLERIKQEKNKKDNNKKTIK